MIHEFNINCLNRSTILKANIKVSQVDHGENLLEYADDTESWNDKDAHLFTSFCRLRKYLKEKEKIMLCKGCRRNVHPFASQLAWMYAFVLTKGKRVDHKKDKVLIFEEELDVEQIVDVEEQEKFYREWWEIAMGRSPDRISSGNRMGSFLSYLKRIFKKGEK